MTLAEKLEKLGWLFLPYDNVHYEWMKFKKGKKVSRQGNAIWASDLDYINRKGKL